MESLNQLIASPLQKQVLLMGCLGLVVSFLISLYVKRFRKSLKVEQVVNVKLNSDFIRLCRILRLPADGFTAVVVDLEDQSIRFVSRSQIFLRSAPHR